LTRLTWLRINEPSPLGYILLTSFLIRLALTPFFYDDFNAWAYGAFGSLLVGGHDPYLVVARDPTLLNINPWRYPPFYLLFTVPALLARIGTGQTLVYLAILKIPLAMCDVVSTLFLYKILETHFSKSIALKGAAAFTFNPAVVFVTAVSGFSDPIAIMFTLIAFYYFQSYKKTADSSDRQSLYKSSLFVGLGMVAKIYPIFLLPIFIRDSKDWKDRLLILAVSGFPVLVFSLPFLIADPYSYLYMLTVKNAGGAHPLFGALSLPIYGQLAILGILAFVLAWIYNAPLPIYSRLVLTFLWINLATLSNTFQYLTWGIPFFILFLYQSKSAPKMLPLYPIIAVFSALVFNGFYDIFSGSTGFYYWMFHVLQQPVVIFRASPLIGLIATSLIPISIIVTFYYLVRIGSAQRREKLWTHLPDIRFPGRIKTPRIMRGPRTLLPLLLITIAAVSWAFVATHSKFENFSYPTEQGTVFNTSFQFRSATLDYQLIFAGGGNYSTSRDTGHIVLSSSKTNSSSYLYRGWLKVLDGFHPSNLALLSFSFKFDDFPPNVSSMNIATFTGGSLIIAANNSGTSFDYLATTTGDNRTIAPGDSQWHIFTVNYTQQNTTVQLDNHSLLLPPTTFTGVMLGNTNDSVAFGRVEYSNFQVSIDDFPGGPSSSLLVIGALAVPTILTILAFGVLPQGFLRSTRQRRSKGIKKDAAAS
jgi:hypothetical protein